MVTNVLIDGAVLTSVEALSIDPSRRFFSLSANAEVQKLDGSSSMAVGDSMARRLRITWRKACAGEAYGVDGG
jgi:hypothetical protein